MRTHLKIMAALAVFIGLCFLAAPNTQAQPSPNTTVILTNISWIGGGQVTNMTNFTTQTVTVKPGYGLGVFVTACSSNAADVATNVTLRLELSPDGSVTNWTTQNGTIGTVGLDVLVPLNGTTAVRTYTNFAPALLDGVRYVRLGCITNANINRVYFTNVVFCRAAP